MKLRIKKAVKGEVLLKGRALTTPKRELIALSGRKVFFY
jgi:hypothetical protein